MNIIAQIVDRIGGDLRDGGRAASCPGPGHSPHDRSMSLKLADDETVLIHSFSTRTSTAECATYLLELGFGEAIGSRSFSASPRSERIKRTVTRQAPEALKKRAICRQWWLRSQPMAGSLAHAYLIKRGFDFSDCTNSAFKFQPNMPFQPYGPKNTSWAKGERIPSAPAFLQAISDEEGSMCGLQITYLDPRTGDRRRRGAQRLIIGSFMGGSVRLAPAGSTLVVGEGVETTYSASRRFKAPGHALLSAKNFYAWTPPKDVRSLIIAADRGEEGQLAADYLFKRANDLGLEARIETPSDVGYDWNRYDQDKVSAHGWNFQGAQESA